MADLLRRKYSGMQTHVIITVYPYALDFLLAERRAPFSEIPDKSPHHAGPLKKYLKGPQQCTRSFSLCSYPGMFLMFLWFLIKLKTVLSKYGGMNASAIKYKDFSLRGLGYYSETARVKGEEGPF
jgi:hypothetical protein